MQRSCADVNSPYKQSNELTRDPLVNKMLPAYGYVAGGAGLHEAEGGGQESHLQRSPARASKYNASGIFSHFDQISIKTPNPKCRALFKNLPVKVFGGRCLSF